MITERVLSILSNIVIFLLNAIPDTLQFPEQLLNSIYHIYDVIFENVGFLSMFIRINTILTLLPLVLVVINLEYIIKLIIWVLGKIPGLNVH